MIDENDIVIEVSHVTKDYGRGRGIFDIDFKIPRGSVFGYCGTNGAGKTTTLRTIMGFIRPDSGYVKVNGLDAYKDAEEIKKYIGYLPGEINFPDVKDGSEFLKIQAEMVGLTDMSKAEKIINAMQLDPTANIRRMSKGMKQKTAIVASMMHSPDIIILDEPTTGLDPLMRASFVSMIKEEKARGATIIMSNHMFDELQDTCDYVGLIKDGHLIDVVDLNKLKNRGFREYKVVFRNEDDFEKCDRVHPTIISEDIARREIIFKIKDEQTAGMFLELKKYQLESFSEIQYTLEQYFLDLMEKKEKKDGE